MLNITKGVKKEPWRLLVYGQPGVGKSTFAAGAPKPLFLDVENRTAHLDIERIKIAHWDGLIDTMRELVKMEPKVYDTIVFDTVDHIELLIFSHLCLRDGVQVVTEAAGGYGKYVDATLECWRKFNAGVEALRGKGYNILLLGHAHIKTFKNPAGEDYDRWQIKLLQKSGDFLKEVVDAMGFAHYDDIARKKNKFDTKAKATSTGEHLITFEHSPCYETKPGLNLPAECTLDFKALGAL